MKRISLLGVFVFFVLLNGCSTLGSSKSTFFDNPRREFQAIEIADNNSTDPFIVNEFLSDGHSFKNGSIYFSTALFLSDIGILEDITKEQFEKYADIFFSNFPNEGELKEIIIPNLSLSQENDIEKNAYFFVTKTKNNEGRDYYLIESNIPINSKFAPYYDGYEINRGNGFYKNIIPASWTSVMNVFIIDDILLYRGIAYPSKSAPLFFTGTGIGSNGRMDTIISGQSTVSQVKDTLKETVDKALETTKAENQQQIDSMKFLKKNTDISLSAYSYIDSNIGDAKRYYLLSKETEVNIPDNAMGSRMKELESIMDYLLNMTE
ncbi:hypothetical protein AGMMS50268_39890 [Spirochaetia bacterium]|nr:hypothetical protein AGMMS50268_39890 [Spirochaetia bacterium]